MNDNHLDRCLVLLHWAQREVVAGPDALLERYNLRRAHHRVLFFVRSEPGILVGELAARLDVTLQALHKSISPLLDQDLVRIQKSEADGRERKLYLTEDGRSLEDEISGMQRKVFARVAKKMGPSALAQWNRVTEAVALEAFRARKHTSK